jgi:hypothetical protein
MQACNLDRWIKTFNGRPFFSCFFIARANQKNRILALGRASTAERQAPDFLIDPRNKKKTKKKGRPPKFFIHRCKLQSGTSDDDGDRESRLVGAVTRPRPTTACSGQLRKRRGAAGGGGDTHRHLCAEFHRKCQLVIWTGV